MKKAMLMLLLALCVTLSGCQNSAKDQKTVESQNSTNSTAETGGSAAEVTEKSPFNTSENFGAWGDEGNFIRITDLTDKAGELRVDDFSGSSFTLSDERDYAVAVYLRNTSDETQKDVVVTLNYADVLRVDEENQLEVLLGWGGESAGFISDALNLETATSLELWPTDNDDAGSMAIIRRSDGELTKSPLLSASLDGSTTQMITLGEVPSGEYCIIFFMFESLPAMK